jgi:MFS family permease
MRHSQHPDEIGIAGTSDWKIAILFSSKAIVQLLVNPLVAPVVTRVGTQLVLLFGTFVMISSSIGFAFGSTFATLLVVRAMSARLFGGGGVRACVCVCMCVRGVRPCTEHVSVTCMAYTCPTRSFARSC